ncbi:nose resistant to fluoxetine protein 6 [Rhipicephalus microplus]|uniref:nose resistant to fluoxetine protein 6 n=1 Tax=Rhipicephalus microplus TaxID=6941 RepID=UPI001886AFA9|nr:nose resistant to fluoxetine protein 6-like [Rhipicephalus microplus]
MRFRNRSACSNTCRFGEMLTALAVILLTVTARCIHCQQQSGELAQTDEVLPAESAVVVQTVATPTPEPSLIDKLKRWIGQRIDESSPALTRKLLTADVSPQCSIGLLKMVRGLRNLEPWALRLFDASGKYPTGALQATKSDFGAFDECLETVVKDSHGYVVARGQYCNLLYFGGNSSDLQNYIFPAMTVVHPRIIKFKSHLVNPTTPTFRIGLCVLNDCAEEELQEIINAVAPEGVVLRISDCVTGEFPPLSRTQIIITSVLGTIASLIVLGTIIDIVTSITKPKTSKCVGLLIETFKSFSLVSNTRMLLSVAKDKGSDSYSYRFLHGVRFLSIAWVVVGHCYGSPSDTWSRVINNVIFAEKWFTMIVAAGFIGVDTFFFMSGFLLAYVVAKQKRSGPVLFIIAVVRRYIRTMVPPFFIIMCMYMLPAITSGPDAKAYFDKFYREVKEHWKTLLLQVDNYNHEYDGSGRLPIIPHFWYLSLDFQFFLVSLIILLLFKSKPRCTIAIFSLLSIAGCAASTWHVAGNDTPPFIVVVDESVTNFFETMYFYYLYPHYHAACYFTGPIAFILLEGFRKRKISKITQLAGWCIAIACGLCCIFMKIGWYTTKYPTTEFGKLSTTFFDRLLWSIFMIWLTLACASGRGGFLNKFLSWAPFAPLARLAFGVYLIHMPFIQLALHISRERMTLSHFVAASFCFSTLAWSYILSYFLFFSCEAPIGKLDKLVFEGLRQKSPIKQVEDTLPTNIEFVTEKQQIAGHMAESNNNNSSETAPHEQQFGLQQNGVKPSADAASCRL